MKIFISTYLARTQSLEERVIVFDKINFSLILETLMKSLIDLFYWFCIYYIHPFARGTPDGVTSNSFREVKFNKKTSWQITAMLIRETIVKLRLD